MSMVALKLENSGLSSFYLGPNLCQVLTEAENRTNQFLYAFSACRTARSVT